MGRRDRAIKACLLAGFLLLVGIVPISTAEEPQTMEPGVNVAAIEGLSSEQSWGFQFSGILFTVSIKANSYKSDQAGVVSLVYADGTCASYDTVGFKLFGSTDGGQSYTEVVNKTDIQSPVRCQFLPDSATFGQSVAARSTSNVWYFAFSVAQDNSGYTYKFRAQFAKDV